MPSMVLQVFANRYVSGGLEAAILDYQPLHLTEHKI